MSQALAPAKINLALVVGPTRTDGRHEVVTVLQRVDLADAVSLAPAERLSVTGFEGDTLVTRALELLADQASRRPGWHVHIEKRIPVAAGLGGGSSDAATALRLANDTLERPLPDGRLAALAVAVGADVPFFLVSGTQVGTGDGSQLAPVDLPAGYVVLLLLPDGETKSSTADVYAAFDLRGGERGFEERRHAFGEALATRDLAALPPNDLASSPLSERLRALGAFRADVSGAGPAVYGLFEQEAEARRAEASLEGLGRTWICSPAWYG
jgi:4-diphosphocytidyl-2-C-methyl-D-erythritol kinase